jgi:hypothetical protein
MQSKIIQRNDAHPPPQKLNKEPKKDIHHTRVESLFS